MVLQGLHSILAKFGLFFLWAVYATAYTTLTEDTLRSLPTVGEDFDIKSGALLSPILVPRVPGSEGSKQVLNHFVDFFKTNLPKWEISFQNSTSTRPRSGGRQIPFVNMIVTRDPPWATAGEVSRLTLVAHYDSKITPYGFIGATDSAAPCAMLLHIARSIDEALTQKWEAAQAAGMEQDLLEDTVNKGVQILLLDGEEAFATWTDTDSLYGARSLAENWETTFHPALSTYRTPLSSISLFVLLDLLGAASPRIPSYFKSTQCAYQKLAALENQFRSLGLFESSPNHKKQRSATEEERGTEPVFLPEAQKSDGRWQGGLIGDDHVPFMQRGVEILHMIPSPFPSVWHHMEDDGEHIDLPTCRDWAQLFMAFTAEWMDLEGFMRQSARLKEHIGDPKKRDSKKDEL